MEALGLAEILSPTELAVSHLDPVMLEAEHDLDLTFSPTLRAGELEGGEEDEAQ